MYINIYTCEFQNISGHVLSFCIVGHKGPFKWFDYLKQTKSLAAPVKLFDKVSNLELLHVW